MASLNFFFKLAYLGCFVFGVAKGDGLKVGYYEEKCPNLEYIVKEVTSQVIYRDPTLAAPLLRMHFHDCFVRVTYLHLFIVKVLCILHDIDRYMFFNFILISISFIPHLI